MTNKNCDCKGRGYFSTDMMGTAFIPCNKCCTHEQCEDGVHVKERQKYYCNTCCVYVYEGCREGAGFVCSLQGA